MELYNLQGKQLTKFEAFERLLEDRVVVARTINGSWIELDLNLNPVSAGRAELYEVLR